MGSSMSPVDGTTIDAPTHKASIRVRRTSDIVVVATTTHREQAHDPVAPTRRASEKTPLEIALLCHSNPLLPSSSFFFLLLPQLHSMSPEAASRVTDSQFQSSRVTITEFTEYTESQRV